MNLNNSSSDEVLKNELTRLGAREYEIVALTMNVERGQAALSYALGRGAEHPIAYAIKMFDNADWNPPGAKKATVTNAYAAPSGCSTCGGDRVVLIGTRPSKNPASPYEDYAPCPDCFTGDISHFRPNGTVFAPPAPERVRQMSSQRSTERYGRCGRRTRRRCRRQRCRHAERGPRSRSGWLAAHAAEGG